MDKFKIEVILRSSPQKSFKKLNNNSLSNYSTIGSKQKNKKYRLPIFYQQYENGVLYGRSPSASSPMQGPAPHPNSNISNNNFLNKASHPQQNIINLRQKIINTKQCLVRPASKKQKQSQMFTQKCLQILEKKKKNVHNLSEHQTRMHAMMTHVVDKYRKLVSQNQQHSQGHSNSTKANDRAATQPKSQGGYSQMTGYEDKIQIYRMIRSTQIPKTSCEQYKQKQQKSPEKQRKQRQDWRSKPDVTGVRMNNRIIKSHITDIQGVQCFSLAISQLPLTKRQSMIVSNQTSLFNIGRDGQGPTRTHSSSSCRKKISIGRSNTQKFMAFSLNQDSDALYMKKLKSFLDFIFKINFSNKIYVSLQLSQDTVNIKKYKVYIGKGNNSLLVKSLLKRRFWLQIVQDLQQEDINFYWTQNKINKVHYKQTISKNTKTKEQSENLSLSTPNQGVNPTLNSNQSQIPILNQNIKRRQLKDPQQKQMFQLNKKILSVEQCYVIQQNICKDGFFISTQKQKQQTYSCSIITNHIPRNTAIGSKKNLFKSLFKYYTSIELDPFNYIPRTYNVTNPQDPQYKQFLKNHENEPTKVWIIKPGQNSNRGTGIKLATTAKIFDIIKRKQKHANGQLKTYIIQSYIEKPFLYQGRKFDIRHYMMITSVNGILKAYWYREGYIRTSSEKYDIEDLSSQQIHLTNDAIQKKYQQYQKYQPGNKLSYGQFQRYLDLTYPNKGYSFQQQIIPKMKSIILDVIKANYLVLDRSRRQCNFQIFGFDFMIDRQFKPWLIQINFNPCLQVNCPVLSRIIPTILENSLRVGLDPLLTPQNHYPANRRYSLSDNYLKNLKYQLIFDQINLTPSSNGMGNGNADMRGYDIEDSDQEEEEYCDEGKEIQELIM